MKSVGVDIIEISRIRRLLARWPEKFVQRVFSQSEESYCFGKRYPAASLAARFAAKEAVLKAMGVGLGACPLKEIEVVNNDNGAPYIRLHGSAEKMAAALGITAWQISLSHSRTDAVAMVLATGPDKLSGR